MHKPMIIAASLLATATLFAMTPGVAMAAQVAVSHTDLDLATPRGQQQLDRRIARAARAICGLDEATTGSRMASRDAQTCYQNALRDVRQRVAAAIEANRRGG